MRPLARRHLFAGSAVLTALAVGGLTSLAAQEPAAAVGVVAKPLSSAQLADVQRQVQAEAADAEAIARVHTAARDADKQERDHARQVAAAEAARAQALAQAQQDPRGVARMMLAERGMGEDQFSCLDNLWQKESNWTVTADNPTSSAYGIPQALPGKKMASAGPDWQTNPVTQITWGLGYIEDRYGTPCKAWNHSQAVNWY